MAGRAFRDRTADPRFARRLAAVAAAALALQAASSAAAQPGDAAQQRFARAYMAAIRGRDPAKLKALFHPATLACINAQTRGYFEDGFAEELQTGATLQAAYALEGVRALKGPSALKLAPGFAYPTTPTFEIQIDAQTLDHHKASLLRYVAPANGVWLIVDPCPNEDGLKAYLAERAKGAAQRAEAARMVAGLPGPLLAELRGLVAKGRWIDAVSRYRDATGADQLTALSVVEVLRGPA
ncbi:hypothetical protein [Phenylobacterium sp.]|jgi:hypothetical protein|uniref:hypothetical protein n=1 Tax=Phenylobacterium sp. TaxID=1871053 RepID=UPI002F403363